MSSPHENHSLLNASGTTHAKIAVLAVAVSLVFAAVISAAGMNRPGVETRASGPVVKAKATVNIARSEGTIR